MLPRGLDSVTVAPGNTAPDESVIVPPIAPTPCANTGGVEHTHNTNATTILTKRRAIIVIPSCQRGFVGTVRSSESIHPRCPLTAWSVDSFTHQCPVRIKSTGHPPDPAQ